MILYWIYKVKVKQNKINLGILYLIIFSVTLCISYISSILIWFVEPVPWEWLTPGFRPYVGALFCYHFFPLSFPLEATSYIIWGMPYNPVYGCIFRLDIFGIPIMDLRSIFSIQELTDTHLIIGVITLISTIITFLINFAFVFVGLAILYIIDKKRVRKALLNIQVIGAKKILRDIRNVQIIHGDVKPKEELNKYLNRFRV